MFTQDKAQAARVMNFIVADSIVKIRRTEVAIDPPLRDTTHRAAQRLHKLFAAQITPTAVREKKCDTCSLLPICLPAAMGPRRSARRFFEKQLMAVLADEHHRGVDVTPAGSEVH